jgi:hypothetical protein
MFGKASLRSTRNTSLMIRMFLLSSSLSPDALRLLCSHVEQLTQSQEMLDLAANQEYGSTPIVSE